MIYTLVAGLFLCLAASARAAPSAKGAEDELDRRIAKLIAQLGDPQYQARERAQQELAKIGFAAFDALSEAENSSDDIEVAAQAKYLVRLIRVEWIQDSDPPQIKQILRDYESQNEQNRLPRIKQLNDLASDAGLEWLCRLARFEQSPVLSKQAALAVMAEKPAVPESAWPKRAAAIQKAMDRSTRPAGRWLRTYVQAHAEPDQAAGSWQKLVEAEQQMLEQHPQQTSYQVVLELMRTQVRLLERLSRAADALAVMRKMVAIERGEPDTLADLVEWLAKRQAWSVVDDVAERFASSFNTDPILMYTLAEARLAQGDDKLAEATAEKAFKLNADRATDHRRAALHLQEHGLTTWSDREFAYIIGLAPSAPDEAFVARLLFCESLHDRQKDQQAGEVLKGAVEALDSQPNILRLVQRLGRNPDAIRSRMNFFFATHALSEAKKSEALAFLDKAIEQDATDADVLILLYRLSTDQPERRKKTVELIKQAVEESRNMIEENPDDPTAYNQLAWLVANTEGDFEEAIRASLRSLDLKRAGGYLDTLGHCYFAKGDYENAVKAQSEAARLEPHSEQIVRQLKVFEQAFARQKKAGGGK